MSLSQCFTEDRNKNVSHLAVVIEWFCNLLDDSLGIADVGDEVSVGESAHEDPLPPLVKCKIGTGRIPLSDPPRPATKAQISIFVQLVDVDIIYEHGILTKRFVWELGYKYSNVTK